MAGEDMTTKIRTQPEQDAPGFKLTKRQRDALEEVLRHDLKGHPYNWREASCKVLLHHGLVTPDKPEMRNGYMTRVRRITAKGRAALNGAKA
jgi:hypothetical protein